MDRRSFLSLAGAAVTSLYLPSISRASSILPQVLIFCGQSNMAGLPGSTKLANASIPKNVEYWPSGRQASTFADRPTFGPEVTFLRKVSAAHQRLNFIAIKTAHGGTSIREWLPGTTYYKEIIKDTRLAVDGREVEYSGFFLMLGETDSKSASKSADYYDNLWSIIKRLRSDLKTPKLPIFIGLSDPPSGDFAHIVRQAQIDIGQTGRVYVIDTQGLQRDPDSPVHYSAKGQVEFGKRYAEEYLKVAT